MSFSAEAGSPIKLEKILAFSSVLTVSHDPDRSHGFWLKLSRCSPKETKPCLSKIPLKYNSYLYIIVAFPKIGQFFFTDFGGLVCRCFEDLSDKKFQNQTVHAYRSFVKEPPCVAYSVSPTNISFEAGCPLKLKLEKILAFSSVLSIPIVHTVFIAKVTMKEVCMDGGPPAKRSRLSPTGVERVTQTAQKRSTSPHGKEKIWRNKGRLPPEEELTRSVYVLSFENGLFFSSQQKFKAEESLS